MQTQVKFHHQFHFTNTSKSFQKKSIISFRRLVLFAMFEMISFEKIFKTVAKTFAKQSWYKVFVHLTLEYLVAFGGFLRNFVERLLSAACGINGDLKRVGTSYKRFNCNFTEQNYRIAM